MDSNNWHKETQGKKINDFIIKIPQLHITLEPGVWMRKVFCCYSTHLSYIEKPYLFKEIKRNWITKKN